MNIRIVRLLFIEFLFLLTSLPSKSINYTRVDALSLADNISVYSVVQDEDGAMWLNTGLGLLRFNGHSVETVSRPLPMHALAISESHLIYAVSPRYILKYDTRSRESSRISVNGIAEPIHSAMLAFGDTLLVGAGKNLYISDSDTLKQVSSFRDDTDICSLLRLSDRSILVCSSNGKLFLVDDNFDTRCVLDSDKGFNSLFQDKRGNIWIGLKYGGVLKYDSDFNYLDSYYAPVRETRTFCEDSNDNIYIGSVDYLYIIDSSGNITIEPSNSPGAHSVCSLYTDRDGNVWVGTFYSGVYLCNLQSMPFRQLTLPENGMLRIVNDIVQDKRGDIWVFTDRYGMYRLSAGKWTLVPGTVQKKIKASWYDPQSDVIWLGLYNDDLQSFHIPSNTWKNYPFSDNGERVSLAVDAILNIDGVLYLGTTYGLWKFDPLTDNVIRNKIGNYRGVIYDMDCAPDGTIWMGGNGLFLCPDGINVLDASHVLEVSDTTMLQRGIFSSVCADTSKIWASVVGVGCMSISGKSINVFNTANCGLADNNTTIVENLGGGRILIGTRSGISILDENSSLCYNYSRSNGLHLSSTRDGDAIRLSDGTYVIGGVDGLEYLSVDNISDLHAPSSVLIDAMTVNNAPYKKYIPQSGYVELDYTQDNFSFEVSSFDYTGVLPLLYEYRMEGFEDEWQTFNPAEKLIFMNMPPGSYVLDVRVSVPGAKSSVCAESSLKVRIRPAWYDTVFARIVFLLLVLGSIVFALVILYSRLLLSQKLQARERENEERTRFFIKVSHELRTPLTLMIGQLEVFFGKYGHSMPGIKNLERSYNSAQEMNGIISGFVEMENKDLTPQVDDLPSEEELMEVVSGSQAGADAAFSSREYTMLIVDDNTQMRSLLHSIFAADYKLIEAVNGSEGLELARSQQPDIIISDVMMPEMDGLTLCAKLRADIQTCHIPIVLITAHVSEKHNLEGMRIGADDYIAKPFAVDLLKARCRNLLANRRLLLEKYGASSQPAHGVDTRLLNAAIGAVERNLYSPELSVSKLCEELSMSKTSLTEHLSKACGLTPREFIEDVRLRHAAQLLSEGKRVSEVSDELGFSSPKYFTIRFKKKFGHTPSSYRV